MERDTNLYTIILENSKADKKMFGVLIDPDKQNASELLKVITLCNGSGVDYFFVGGSILASGEASKTVRFIKENSSIPVILFPGNPTQVTGNADALLFLSLISGRNPEFLIGNHVIAAPSIRKKGLEVIPTGYMLVDCGNLTTALYISGTNPIPYDKPEIAEITALAGEYLGLKMIYMDGGSGAKMCMDVSMISRVKEALTIPLIIGGGIKSADMAEKVYNAGADLIIIGNGIEGDKNLIHEVAEIRSGLNTLQKV